MLTVTGLTKRYGARVAVDDLTFAVARGETLGLLGPNGAGKTTTLQMLVGALAPDAGSVRFDDGRTPSDPAARARIGIAPQAIALYPELTAAENLAFFGALYGLACDRLRARVAWCLDFAGAHRPPCRSGGDLLGRHAAPPQPGVRARARADTAPAR